MNNLLKMALAAVLFACLVPSAQALSAPELAGIYQGTSTATLPNGQQINANLSITFKAKGKVIVTATENGYSSTSKGKFFFASDNVIVGNFESADFTAFVEIKESGFSFTLLINSGAGIITERTNLTLVQKL